MADWGTRAKDKDRDAALKQINDAAARGQIVAADREKRIQEVKAAQTVGELELLTRGLAAAPAAAAGTPAGPPPVSTPGVPVPTFQQYTPPTSPPATEPNTTEPNTTEPPPLSTSVPPSNWLPSNTVQYGAPLGSSGTSATPPMIKRSGAGGKLMLIVVLCIVAGVALPIFFGIKALVDTVDDLPDIGGVSKADVFSDAGLADLVDAVEEKTGGTEAFELDVYDGYAIVYLPTDNNSKRYIAYRFDGHLEEFTKGTESDDLRIDLADVNAKVLRDLAAAARRMVEGTTSNYVLVRPSAPPFGDGKAQVLAFASNEFGESGHIEAKLDGTIIKKYPPS
jgi:Domain of unknown function (DUF1707)